MIIVNNNLLDTDYTRPSFTSATLNVIDPYRTAGQRSGTDYCHSISANNIQLWITEIINDSTSAVQAATGLNNLAIALTTTDSGFGTPSAVAAREIANIQNELNANPINISNVATYANNLYKEFFNEVENLRIGSYDWNRDIKENYDPRSWAHVDGTGSIDFTNLGYPTRQTTFIVPSGFTNCFFLTDDFDNMKITAALAVDPTVTPLCVLANGGNSQGAYVQFIHSSDNNFYLDDSRNLQTGDQIYFFNFNNSAWEQI